MQKLRPKSPNGANSPSFYSSPPITTFNHTRISLLPVPKFQPASGKPRPRAGVLKFIIAVRSQIERVELLGYRSNDYLKLQFSSHHHRHHLCPRNQTSTKSAGET